jgi:CubicO group peptidase (beta-lactamase class C family)
MNDHISFHALEDVFREGLQNGTFSGASLLAASSEGIALRRTWGMTRLGGLPVDSETSFDLASLTKPLVVSALCIRAVSENAFSLEDPVSRFFQKSVVPGDKREINLRHLLSHCSGLAPYMPYFRELIRIPDAEKRDALLFRILHNDLLSPPGRECHYSDLGFLLLGIILESVYGRPLDQLFRDMLLMPLGIESPAYRRMLVPADPETIPHELARGSYSCAATEQCPWRRRLLEGEVHDENAYSLGGVAGHSGLFGTAYDVFLLISFLWKIYNGSLKEPGWSGEVVEEFWTRQDLVAESTWALGFDTPSSNGYSSTGDFFSPRSVGHLGFTGTSFWLDLDRDVLIILLTNRVYPTRENNKIRQFRPLVHNIVMKELLCRL